MAETTGARGLCRRRGRRTPLGCALRQGAAWAVLVGLSAATAEAADIRLTGDEMCDYSDGGITVRVVLPLDHPAGKPVRGVFIAGNAGRGDDRVWALNRQFRSFATRFGFGTVSTADQWGGDAFDRYGQIVLDAVTSCGAEMAHAEMKDAPFVGLGNSSSGAAAYGVCMLAPQRCIAFGINVPAGLNPRMPSGAMLKVPGIMTAGETDSVVGNADRHVNPVMASARPKGALWSKIEIEGMGHEHRRTMHLFYPFFEKAIALRYPSDEDPGAGPVALLPVEESSGYLADDSTWGSGFTEIAAYDEFAGDKRGPDTSWLLDEDMAFLHRAYSSRDVAFEIASEDEVPWKISNAKNTDTVVRRPGETLILMGEAMQPGWDKLELFRGATRLAERSGGGRAFSFEVAIDGALGLAQAFSVVAHTAAGRRPSHMFTVLVPQGDPVTYDPPPMEPEPMPDPGEDEDMPPAGEDDEGMKETPAPDEDDASSDEAPAGDDTVDEDEPADEDANEDEDNDAEEDDAGAGAGAGGCSLVHGPGGGAPSSAPLVVLLALTLPWLRLARRRWRSSGR